MGICDVKSSNGIWFFVWTTKISAYIKNGCEVRSKKLSLSLKTHSEVRKILKKTGLRWMSNQDGIIWAYHDIFTSDRTKRKGTKGLVNKCLKNQNNFRPCNTAFAAIYQSWSVFTWYPRCHGKNITFHKPTRLKWKYHGEPGKEY